MKRWSVLPYLILLSVWLATIDCPAEDSTIDKGIVETEGIGTAFEAGTVVIATDATVDLYAVGDAAEVSIFAQYQPARVHFTVHGLNPDTTYHLYIGDYRNHEVVATDSSGALQFEVDLSLYQSIFIQSKPSTVIIGASGPNLPVGIWDSSTLTLTLTEDVFETILFAGSGITLEGNGHKVTGSGGGNGIVAVNQTNVTIKNCDVSNFRIGLLFLGGGDHRVEFNSIHDNTFAGMAVVNGCNDSEIVNNQIFENGFDGYLGRVSSRVLISGNTFNNNANGVRIPSCNDYVISNNQFLNHLEKDAFASAIAMFQGSGHRFENNYFSNNHFGIDIENISNTIWRNNTIEDSVREAVQIYASFPEFLEHDIDTSNTVDGKVIYYLKNQSGLVMNPNTFPNAATIYCINCDNMVIEDYTFDSHTENAVYLSGTTNSVVRRIKSFENNLGVKLAMGSSNNIVEDCTIVERGRLENGINLFDEGIDVFDGNNAPSPSSYNLIQNNVILFLDNGFGGIKLNQGPSHNIIRGNILMGPSGTGINSNGNDNITECNILSGGAGIHILTAYGGAPLIIWRADRNKVLNNVVRNGSHDFFSEAAPGMRIEATADLEVKGNIFINMQGDGIWISDQVFNFSSRNYETFPVANLKVSGNDFIDNAQNGVSPEGTPVFQVTSLAGPFELSVDGLGNYWNRDVAPYFVPGVDSSSTDVTDSYPSATPFVLVEIDIKPGEEPNSINLGSEGVVPVAILSSLHFDATTIDPSTVLLEGASVRLAGNGKKIMAHEEDVNGDGLVDLVCQIDIKETILTEGQDTAILVGKTYEGQLKFGEDSVRVVP